MSFELNDFNIDVIEASRRIPVLVDFWAAWCGPCKALGPVLEKLAAANESRFTLVKIDTDASKELAAQFNIRSIPAVKLFIDGKVVDEFLGALPEKQIIAFLDKNIPGENSKKINAALEMLSEGNEGGARIILEELAKNPVEHKAKIFLAKIILFEDNARAEELLRSSEPAREEQELFDALELLSGLIGNGFNASVLPEDNVKAKYCDAVNALHQRRFGESLEIFIDCIRENRYYNDDGARKICVAVFKYLGEEHPVTLMHRRDFGRALYI